jgi:hypothetical protein
MPRITLAATSTSRLAGGVVIEEEQRLGALHHQVVHAHCDQVDADRVVDAELDRQPQLGADAVGTGHQYRLAVACRQFAQCAEAADSTEHLGTACTACDVADAPDQRVAGVDVDAGILVGKTTVAGFGHGRSPLVRGARF